VIYILAETYSPADCALLKKITNKRKARDGGLL